MDKLAAVKRMVGISDTSQDEIISVYLDISAAKILCRAFPYLKNNAKVPTRYEPLQCEIAAYLFNKRGAEGETAHSENGVSRSYESADVPESMLKAVVPCCGVIE